MILVGAILLAIYALDSPWDVLVVAAGFVLEVAETGFWFWYTKRRRPAVGVETLLGQRARVVADCVPEGQVRVAGELWQARCEHGARVGEDVFVHAVEGLTLYVSREPLATSPG